MRAGELDVTPAGAEVEILPAATRARVEPLIQAFREGGLSGSVTIVLHFFAGRDMPSEVGMHERLVGARRNP